MKHTKTKSVDARRLAETEMDDDVKSFILFISLSLFSLKSFLAHDSAHKVNAPPAGSSLFCVFASFGRVYVRDICVTLSL